MNQHTDSFIPFARPSLGDEEERAVLRVMRSGWLTTGEETGAFETEFAAFIGSPHALAVNSATAGLHLALEAAGVTAGSLVATTPYTFTATAETIRYLGAHPLFVDIERGSGNISPGALERAFEEHGKKISAVIVVHLGGHPCDMERITAIAGNYGSPVIEDAAHAFPAWVNGRMAGTIGTIGVYSFYATKTITTGEGGMAVTSNPELARRMKVMRLHGIDRDVWDRYTSRRASWHYQVVDAGFKYNMPDILAAIGRVQLGRAPSFLEERRRVARTYRDLLEECDFLILPPEHPGHSWHLFMVALRPEKLAVSRDQFVDEMSRRGVGTSVHYIPLHVMPYYRNLYGFTEDSFPVSWDKYQHSFSLPIYPDLTREQTERVAETVREIGRAFHRG